MLNAWRRVPSTMLVQRRKASTTNYNAARMLKKYPLGKELSGYTIERVLPVPELSLTAVDLVHNRTGSRHLHVDRADKNNVFSIVFKTNPPDKTGVPHILEHTTLCGSEKFPVRDPFFKMLNRSLSNFMNAMTAHDYTYYPFATTNRTDFYNLMDVYLDATLNPTLAEEDFFQEGWRLENEDVKDKNSPLAFKGVVYNEMKGQMSDPFYYFWIRFQENIYPSLNNSGGDPAHITNLQYPDLVDFHSRCYHPSNARTYTYGDMPLNRHLEMINERFAHFGKRHRRNIVKEPINLDGGSQNVELQGPVDPMVPLENQWKTSLTWFTGSPQDVYETFKLKVLSILLSDGHSAPLYQKLIETNIGTDFSINSGMESMPSVNIFTIGLQGLTKENSEVFENIVQETLREICQTGFPKERVQAIINQSELSRKVESATFGLGMLNSIVSGWVDEVDPLKMMNWNEVMDRFEAEFESRGNTMFTELIETHLLGSNHFKFTMSPSTEFETSVSQEEEKRLAALIEKLTPEDKDIIFARGQNLAEKQEEVQDLSCLPSLSVTDISRDGDYVDLKETTLGETEVFTRVSSKTNGLTYFRATKTVDSKIPVNLLPFIPLFTDCLTHLGTHTESMAELEREIKLHTGGVSSSVFVTNDIQDVNTPVLKMSFSGVSLDNKFPKVVEILEKLIRETNFDNVEKLSILIRSLSTDNISSIVSSGHTYAKTYSTSFLSPVALVDDYLGGIRQVRFLKQLGEWNANGELQEMVIPQLKKIQKILVNGADGFRFALTCGRGAVDTNLDQLSGLVARFESENPELFERTDAFVRDMKVSHDGNSLHKAAIKLPSQVAFVSRSVNTGLSYADDDAASLRVLTQLLNFKRLHTEVREKGGAYGGGVQFAATAGLLNFYSYRDPRPLNSLEVFNGAGKWLTESIDEISEDDLDRAKLTIFQRMDSPISVREEGMLEFSHGLTNDLRQELREKLLDVELADVQRVGETYLVGPGFSERGSAVILGADEGVVPGWDITDLST